MGKGCKKKCGKNKCSRSCSSSSSSSSSCSRSCSPKRCRTNCGKCKICRVKCFNYGVPGCGGGRCQYNWNNCRNGCRKSCYRGCKGKCRCYDYRFTNCGGCGNWGNWSNSWGRCGSCNVGSCGTVLWGSSRPSNVYVSCNTGCGYNWNNNFTNNNQCRQWNGNCNNQYSYCCNTNWGCGNTYKC